MEKRKIIGLLGFLFLLLALPLALLVMRQQVQYRGRATYPASQPKNIRITNIHDKGFTVSWTTDQDTLGAVSIVLNNNAVQSVGDIRGNTISSKTHYVDVFDGLADANGTATPVSIQPSTTYAFLISSGEPPNSIFGKNPSDTDFYSFPFGVVGGANFIVNTAPTISYVETNPDSTTNTPGAYSLEPQAFATCNQNTTPAKATCFRPNPVWGQVLNSSNQPVEGAIVYMNLSGTSQTLSALTQGSTYIGKWVMDLANFRISNLSQYASYMPFNETGKSTLTFTVQGGASGTKTLPGVEVPEVINIPASGTGSDCATVPANCLAPLLPPSGIGWVGTTDADKFIQLGLVPLAVTPSPSVVTPSPSVVTPSPSQVTPSPSVVTPSPSIITPSPSQVTPSPSVVTPSPSVITPSPSVVTPSPSVVTPSPTGTYIRGDGNFDGFVDERDYSIWVNHYGQTTDQGPDAPRSGDFNKDSFVDERDYSIWVNNYTGS